MGFWSWNSSRKSTTSPRLDTNMYLHDVFHAQDEAQLCCATTDHRCHLLQGTHFPEWKSIVLEIVRELCSVTSHTDELVIAASDTLRANYSLHGSLAALIMH